MQRRWWRRPSPANWLWSTATAIPSELTSEESGYFSIVEGKNGRIYVGTAKYDQNAFDPAYESMPLEAFEPMVMKLFAAPKNSIYVETLAKTA